MLRSSIRPDRLRPLCTTVVGAALAVLATCAATAPLAAAATSAPGDGFGATAGALAAVHVVTVDTRGTSTTTTATHWRSGDLRTTNVYTESGRRVGIDYSARTRGTTVAGRGFASHLLDGVLIRNDYDVSPDGFDLLSGDLLGAVWPLVARQRSGGAPAFKATTVGGRRLLTASVRVAANECAGLAAGVRTVLVDPRTLLPVRVTERRAGKQVRDAVTTVRRATSSDFTPVHLVGDRDVSDAGFQRRTPAAAAAQLGFPVSVPATVPAGFRFAWSGAATLGMPIGPEGSFPRSNGLFGARWERGIETLELTMRGATGTLQRDWDESDPFGAECGSEQVHEATVVTSSRANLPAHYAVPETGLARLWWRDGKTLYTLAGPFSQAQLQEVASSLQTVSAPTTPAT